MPFSKDITDKTGLTLTNHRLGVTQFSRRLGEVQLVVDSRTSKALKDSAPVKTEGYTFAWSALPQSVRDDYKALEAKLETFIMAHDDFSGATDDPD